jgi:Dolichyl-phosphate-mannose-protein mannosyltransferase
LAGDTAAVEGAPARALVRAVPVWVWLTALVAVSALVRFALARRVAAPWIMVDELIYSELAKSFGESARFEVRGVATYGYGFVYPILISPAYALFDSLPRAYDAVRAINAALMSLAALPAYFLARRVLPTGLSVFAALLAVALPSLLYAGEVMTENAFYPLFLCVALVFVLALERPTPARQGMLLALCVLAYLTRAQALAFFPAILAAPLLLGTWRRFRVLYGAVGAAIAGLVAVQLVRGESPLDVLGAYAVTGEHRYDASEVARWLLYHVAELDLYLGVFPFAALVVLLALWRRLPRALRPFLAATASLSTFFVLEVAAFASLPSVERIEERNLFYLAPLALIALLVWVDQGAPRPALAAGVAAVLGAALPGVIPYERLIGVPSQSDTLMLIPLWRLHERWFALDELAAVALVASVAAAVLFLVVPRRYALVLPLVVLAYFLVAQRPISARLEYASLGALAEGVGKRDVDWIDRTSGGRPTVILWTGNTSRFSVWQNEFFNRSVASVYHLREPMGGGLPTTALTLDRRTGILRDPRGQTLAPEFALSDGSATPAGTLVDADEKRGVFLYRVDAPLRQTAIVDGLHPNDTWSGATVTYSRLACTGGTLTVLLQSDPNLYQDASTVTVRGTELRKVVPPDNRAHAFTIPLRESRGECTVTFDVSPAVVPGHGDLRTLGLHFNVFRYRP